MSGLNKLAGCLAMLALLSGCAVPLNELRHSGGYPGKLMDKRLFDASGSKQLQLLRSTIIIALASRVGLATVKDGKEADAFLDYIVSATREVNYLAAHIYDVKDSNGQVLTDRCTTIPTAAQTCNAHAALFEADVPQMEYKIVRLVVAALPQRQAADFLKAASSGDMLSAAWKFLRLVSASLDGAHRGAAAYRSTQEILALALANDQDAAGNSKCKNNARPDSINTVEDAVSCLGLSPTNIFKNPGEVTNWPKSVPANAFDALFGMMRISCGLLPMDLTLDGTNKADGTTILTNRRNLCLSLKFQPARRFGGFSMPAAPAAPNMIP